MKSALKVVLSLLALGLVAGAPIASAQDQTPPPQGQKGPGGGGGGRGGRGMMSPEERIKLLDEAVKLTAEQKAKVTEIFKKADEKRQSLAPEDRRTKGQEIRTATNAEIRALLTAEQHPKFDALSQRGPGGPGGPGGGAPGSHGGGEKKTN